MHQSETVFTASWGSSTRILTFAAVAIMVVISIMFIAIGLTQPPHRNTIPGPLLFVIAISELLLPLIVFCLSPKDYVLTPSEIVVRRRSGRVVIPLDNVASVGLMSGKDVFSRAMRLYASGGMFGFFGVFSSPDMDGRFTAYATRTDGMLVVLKLNHGKPVVLSPDQPEQFAEAAQAALGAKL